VLCPFCGSQRIAPFLAKEDNTVEYRCRDCGRRFSVRVVPRPPRQGIHDTPAGDRTRGRFGGDPAAAHGTCG
jgi:tRNA(Ile2) C34 agmatinyltransferase TiaS